MATYWVTEALPLAITALLPVVLFPLLGVLDGATVAAAYIAVRRHTSLLYAYHSPPKKTFFCVPTDELLVATGEGRLAQ